MTLTGGTRLGHYQVVSLLGAGGMGEVYRATDTQLHRDVALKVLPEEFSSDAERMARLEREAHMLASLNHPNIAAIHGLEESNGVRALAMELVDGPTLAERIARGPIPIDEALPIVKQIAEALEYAHERGIIHRDLKPANVKITPDGAVKVLDFGLAKALEGDLAAVDASKSPTLTVAASRAGVILGTAAYMSPEQAKGKSVDRRADVWSFGCVFYEMLTGRRAFQGETISDTLAAVIKEEPDWNALRAATPSTVSRLLRRCLLKDARQRLQAIGEARAILEGHLTGSGTAAVETSSMIPVAHRPLWQRALPWAVAAAAIAFASLGVWRPRQESPKSAPPVRLSVQLGVDAHLGSQWGAHAVLSPDGRRLAFAGRGTDQKSKIYVRPLDQLHAILLSGTENARNPFFSPDGQSIAFFADGKLKKISVQGGSAVTLCDAPDDRGGSWGEDGTIVFAPENRGGLHKLPSAGGAPEPLTTLDQAAGEVTHRWPQVLPGAKAILITTHDSFDNYTIVAQSLETGQRKTVVKGGFYGRYLPSGHLAYVREGTLFAVPFDADRLETNGQPVPVPENVATNLRYGAAQFDFSRTGTLLYLPGTAVAGVSIYWMDQTGKMTPLLQAKGDYRSLSFSPDGKRLAMEITSGAASDVWIYELERETLTRLTFDGAGNWVPVWTADGRRVTFRSGKVDAPGIYWKRADGAGDAQRLIESKNAQRPYSWSPDGKTLAFQELDAKSNWDVWTLPIKGDERSGWEPGKPALFLSTPASEMSPMFSPDGRWLAYNSNESGKFEVYVRAFPGPGGKEQISTDGGWFPKWSPSGKELFYRTDDQRIWVSTYSASRDAFVASKPRLWSEGRFTERASTSNFDLARNGKRFAVLKVPEGETESATDKVTLILNFFDELRRIAPVK